MAVQIIRAGQTVRVQVRARSIADTYVAGGYLYVVYSDGTVDQAGYVGGGYVPPVADIDNTYANTNEVYASEFMSDFLVIQDQIILLENGATVDGVYASSTDIMASYFASQMTNIQNQIRDLEA